MLLLFCVAGYPNTDSASLQESTVTSDRLSGRPMAWFRSESLKVLTARVNDNWQLTVSPLDYCRLLNDLHAQQDLIPLRYGSLLADDNELERWLKENKHTLSSRLEQLQGGVEMTVLLPDKSVTSTVESGINEMIERNGAAYLQARRNWYAHTRHHEPLLPLKEEVKGLYRNCRVESVCYMDQPFVSVHFFVLRHLVKTFQQRLAPLLEKHPDWTSCGPCPPFSFLN